MNDWTRDPRIQVDVDLGFQQRVPAGSQPAAEKSWQSSVHQQQNRVWVHRLLDAPPPQSRADPAGRSSPLQYSSWGPSGPNVMEQFGHLASQTHHAMPPAGATPLYPERAEARQHSPRKAQVIPVLPVLVLPEQSAQAKQNGTHADEMPADLRLRRGKESPVLIGSGRPWRQQEPSEPSLDFRDGPYQVPRDPRLQTGRQGTNDNVFDWSGGRILKERGGKGVEMQESEAPGQEPVDGLATFEDRRQWQQVCAFSSVAASNALRQLRAPRHQS